MNCGSALFCEPGLSRLSRRSSFRIANRTITTAHGRSWSCVMMAARSRIACSSTGASA
uniref:Uncharacterized protein n=1 Tax=Siphoviridae sp. ct2zh4 TaxID=2825319 RepID=A0A8S5NT15_9CAUD|nr:MAG TPA: hypothetical protein [Siphoviridae sp. ct2zh4]